MSRQPFADAYANYVFGEPPSSAEDQDRPTPTPTFPSNIAPRGIDVVVHLGVAIIHEPGNDGRSIIQVLSPHDQRIPVPLDHVRSFNGIKRCLRNLLKNSLAQYGITPAQMTQAAAIVPIGRYSAPGGFLGMTGDQVTWQNYTNIIASLYHAPCATPSSCEICIGPAHVIACFPARDWTSIPLNTGLVNIDDCCEELSQTLGELSLFERDRYVRIFEEGVSAESALSAHESSQNSTNPASSQSSTNPEAAATRGPKGRSLIGAERTTSTKVVDYSQGTLFPSNAQQGIKAESDICLTCLRYGRRCKGTTMNFVKSLRADRPSQWKCESCQNPQRRCVWRPSMDEVTSYDEAFKADGGKNVVANTVQGRMDRARRRSAAMVKVEQDNDDGHEDGEDADDEHIDQDEQDYSFDESETILVRHENGEDNEETKEAEEADSEVRIKQEE